MRVKRPSWTVRRDVAPVPASWAISQFEEEEPVPAPIPLPAPAPPSQPRLSLVPPPAPSVSELDDLRATVSEQRSELDSAAAIIDELQMRLASEKQAFEKAREQLVEEARGAIIQLATAIAERAVGAELVHSPELIEQWAAEASAILGGGTLVGSEVAHDGSVIEVTPGARVAAVVSALEERKAA